MSISNKFIKKIISHWTDRTFYLWMTFQRFQIMTRWSVNEQYNSDFDLAHSFYDINRMSEVWIENFEQAKFRFFKFLDWLNEIIRTQDVETIDFTKEFKRDDLQSVKKLHIWCMTLAKDCWWGFGEERYKLITN